jgi:transposase
VYDAHKSDVLESLRISVLQSDDTTVVQRNGRQSGRRDVHVWAWRDQHAGVFYQVTESRNRDGPKAMLDGREGRLQCDGHDCYAGLDPGKIMRIGCWSHVRRYFEKALKRGDKHAKQPMDWIGKLFEVEREAKKSGLTDAQLVELRQENSAPILTALQAWLDDAQLHPPSLPAGPLMKGVGYAVNQWDTLGRFLTDGRIREISNNGCERALRATVIGRKNWYFFGNEEGADAAVVLMSLVQSCREHGINPLLYLRDALSAVSSTPTSKVATLTPKAWKAREGEQQRLQRSRDAVARAVQSLTFRA